MAGRVQTRFRNFAFERGMKEKKQLLKVFIDRVSADVFTQIYAIPIAAISIDTTIYGLNHEWIETFVLEHCALIWSKREI